MTNKNRIPRTFYNITGKMLIATDYNQPGDVFHVYKNTFGYIGMNARTGKYIYIPASLIRDASAFQVLHVSGGRVFCSDEQR